MLLLFKMDDDCNNIFIEKIIRVVNGNNVYMPQDVIYFIAKYKHFKWFQC